MSRLDRLATGYRARALAEPLTRAGGFDGPSLELSGGIIIGLSVNK